MKVKGLAQGHAAHQRASTGLDSMAGKGPPKAPCGQETQKPGEGLKDASS